MKIRIGVYVAMILVLGAVTTLADEPLEDRVMSAREYIGLPPFAVDEIGQPRQRRGAEFDGARLRVPNEKQIAHRAFLRNQYTYRREMATYQRSQRMKWMFYSRLFRSHPNLAIQLWEQHRSKYRNP